MSCFQNYIRDKKPNFTNIVIEILLEVIAHLTDPKIQLEAIKAFSIANCTVLLGRDRNCKSLSLVLAARITRYNLHVLKMIKRNR